MVERQAPEGVRSSSIVPSNHPRRPRVMRASWRSRGRRRSSARTSSGCSRRTPSIDRIVAIDVKAAAAAGQEDALLRGRPDAARRRGAPRGDPRRRARAHARPPRFPRVPFPRDRICARARERRHDARARRRAAGARAQARHVVARRCSTARTRRTPISSTSTTPCALRGASRSSPTRSRPRRSSVASPSEARRSCTVLRTAPILGPTVKNFLTRYLSRRVDDDDDGLRSARSSSSTRSTPSRRSSSRSIATCRARSMSAARRLAALDRGQARGPRRRSPFRIPLPSRSTPLRGWRRSLLSRRPSSPTCASCASQTARARGT